MRWKILSVIRSNWTFVPIRHHNVVRLGGKVTRLGKVTQTFGPRRNERKSHNEVTEDHYKHTNNNPKEDLFSSPKSTSITGTSEFGFPNVPALRRSGEKALVGHHHLRDPSACWTSYLILLLHPSPQAFETKHVIASTQKSESCLRVDRFKADAAPVNLVAHPLGRFVTGTTGATGVTGSPTNKDCDQQNSFD